MDGNKRTAFLIADLFLNRSDYTLRGIKKRGLLELEDLILSIAQDHLTKDEIAAWFAARVRKL